MGRLGDHPHVLSIHDLGEDNGQPYMVLPFGKTVILAARIASQAVGGQVLVSSLLKALVESSGEFEFAEGRDVELKGIRARTTCLECGGETGRSGFSCRPPHREAPGLAQGSPEEARAVIAQRPLRRRPHEQKKGRVF